MKNTILSILFLFFIISLSAQVSNKASAVTDKWGQRYQLSTEQKAEVLTIQERKIRNLKEIASLQQSNPELYLKKKNFIAKNTLTTFKKILTEEQLSIYESDMKAYQKKQSEKIAEMKEAGIKASAIKLAVADVEF